MGWSSNQVEGTGWMWSYIQYSAGTRSRVMLKYTNDTGAPVSITSCYFNMGAGKSGVFGGYSASTTTYTCYASFTDSNGTTHTSNTLTVNNVVSSTSYSGVAKKTFTFAGGSYIAPGATVSISVYFVTTAMTVVIARTRNDSSTYGGSVSQVGSVRIYTSRGWKQAIPFVYTSNGWKQAIPYVYTHSGSTWKICS